MFFVQRYLNLKDISKEFVQMQRLFLALLVIGCVACGEDSSILSASNLDATTPSDATDPEVFDIGTILDDSDAGVFVDDTSTPEEADAGVFVDDTSTPEEADIGASVSDASNTLDAAGSVAPDRSTGCGSNPVDFDQRGAKFVEGGVNFTINQKVRRFRIQLPQNYDSNRAYNLSFIFHARAENQEDVAAQVEDQLADTRVWDNSAIFVLPFGSTVTEPNGTTAEGWHLGGDGDPQNDDLLFFDQMLEYVEQTLCFDRGRIFAQGFSFGGAMIGHLACYRGDILRGIAAGAARIPASFERPEGGDPLTRYGSPNRDDLECVGTPAAYLARGALDNLTNQIHIEDQGELFSLMNNCQGQRNVDLCENTNCECVEYTGCESPVVYCTDNGTEQAGPPGHFFSPSFYIDYAVNRFRELDD